MKLEDLVNFLTKRLKEPLPGWESQIKMAPKLRNPDSYKLPDKLKAKVGGVLIFLYNFEKTPYVLLMKRPDYQGVHSGQVSFPGGKKEDSDRNIIETAIREFSEETGVSKSNLTIIGSLSELYIPASNFYIYPTIAYSTQRPEMKPDKKEVAYLLEIKVRDLINDNLVKDKKITAVKNFELIAPCIEINNEIIWGATAMVISEFKTILQELRLS
ncbi:MAG: CoA pyrophosphatase [Chitinophagaceae bacterium]|nr:MAG: CoA pyrophosphatase [Chitinophagaceae bacterium]